MSEKDAIKKITELLEEAEAKLSEAEDISKKYNVPFSWHGPEYGMGGYFLPEPDEYGDSGWVASSHSC